jgi:hypothetical protein
VRYAIAAATLLVPATANADAYDFRDPTTDFTLTIGAVDGKVCIAFPVEKRTASCNDLDLSTLRYADGSFTAVVAKPEWPLTVTVASNALGGDTEYTAAEEREAHRAFFRAVEQQGPVKHEPFERLRINGLQAYRARLERFDMRETVYMFITADGATVVRFAYPKEVELEAGNVMDSIVATAHARRAKPVPQRLFAAVLNLLVGVPLVVLAAAIANRKRAE